MAGSLLGPDQVKKVNTLYSDIVAHIRSLFGGDQTPVSLMRIHFLTEFLDTTELSKIFMQLTFLSPAEKRALVRAAIFDVLCGVKAAVDPNFVVNTSGQVEKRESAPATFTPPRFTLNVNAASAFHGQAPADTPPPTPVVTSTHTSKVAEQVKQGERAKQVEQSRLDAAVKEIRKTPAKDVR